MNQTLTILVFFFFTQQFGLSQNLIPNGSFEECKYKERTSCPNKFNDLAGGWEVFTTFTDTFARPSLVNLRFKSNKHELLNKYPQNIGTAYLHYYNYRQTKKNSFCKTIFQVPLNKPLIKGEYYKIFYYIKIHIDSLKPGDQLFYENYFQIFTSKFSIKDENISNPFDKNNLSTISIPICNKCRCNDNWVMKYYKFQANEDANFLLFGTIVPSSVKEVSFDHIKLFAIKKSKIDLSKMDIGSNFTLNNILFEWNDYKLKKSSFSILNTITENLEDNPTIKIQISGHTDNTGDAKKNMELSKNRAKSVVDYLISQGIEQNRLSYKGYGANKPIADNSTKEGKKENRRVEVILLEK